MPQNALFGTLAVYLVLVVLLLSLNIFSLWKWWVKAGAIVIGCACVIAAYFSITAMIGWPTFTALPKRFNLVATRTVEPDRASGAPGHVYLWVEEINQNNVPIGAPRGYEVPYTVKLADDTKQAQDKINSGQQIMGQSGGGVPAEGQNAQAGKAGEEQGHMGGKTGNGSTTGGQSTAAETIGEGSLVTFSDMPAVALPDKAFVVPPDGG
ncbi:MAG: hypothetical protein P4M09_25560 [Devosia sp.]|nr:hypothetical protein [Devosia sp.]